MQNVVLSADDTRRMTYGLCRHMHRTQPADMLHMTQLTADRRITSVDAAEPKSLCHHTARRCCSPTCISLLIQEHDTEEQEGCHRAGRGGIVWVCCRQEAFKLVVLIWPHRYLLLQLYRRVAASPVVDDELEYSVDVWNVDCCGKRPLQTTRESRVGQHRGNQARTSTVTGATPRSA